MNGDGHARVRQFYIWANFVEALGLGMTTIVSSYLLFHLTNSTLVVGLIVVCTNLPPLLLPGVIGVLIGGALIARIGPGWIYLAGALTYLPCIFAIAPLATRSKPGPQVQRDRFRNAFAVLRVEPGL